MGRNMRFLESDATPEEDSHDYRVEWDDRVYFDDDFNLKHDGPGYYDFIQDYDGAWDLYCELDDNHEYKNVRIITLH